MPLIYQCLEDIFCQTKEPDTYNKFGLRYKVEYPVNITKLEDISEEERNISRHLKSHQYENNLHTPSSSLQFNKDKDNITVNKNESFWRASYLDPFQNYLSEEANFLLALCINIFWTSYISFQLYPPIGVFLKSYFFIETRSRK